MSHPLSRGRSFFDERKIALGGARFHNEKPFRLYVIESDYGTKVGITAGESSERRRVTIEMASGMPMRIVREYAYPDRYTARDHERAAHEALAATRTIGEWFHCHPSEAIDAIERIRRDAHREEQSA